MIVKSEELFKMVFTVYGHNFDKAGETSTEIKSILKGLEIDSDIIRRAVVVAFEVEMNVVMYANLGTLSFTITDEGIDIEVADEGPEYRMLSRPCKKGFPQLPTRCVKRVSASGWGCRISRKIRTFLKSNPMSVKEQRF